MQRSRSRPRVIHLTTVDMSLVLLLLPQLVAFREAGYEVIGVSAPGQWVPQLEDAGIRHVPLKGSTRAADVRSDLRAVRSLAAIVRDLRPDVLHTHNPKPGIYGRVVGRALRVPAVVNTVHGLYAQPTDPLHKRAVVYGLERIAAACSHAELVQNPEDVATLRSLRIPPSRVHLLGNGVDLSRFDPDRHRAERARVRAELGVADDEVLVGAIGRLVLEKGYRELFEAARAVRASTPRARFVVVGPHDPDKADAVGRDEIARAEQDGIVFTGLRSDVEALYAAMDVYVLASHREGWPRSAMEAAAMGLPVVATDIRGCRQVVDDGVNGVLVGVRDPAALADAITTLVTDDDRRRRMAEAALTKAAADFDDRTQVRRTLAVYRQLLGDRAPDRDESADVA